MINDVKVAHLLKLATQSISINDERVSTSYNEKMDCLVPAAKIADMATGWICGQTARDFTPTEAACSVLTSKRPTSSRPPSSSVKPTLI